MNQVMTMINKIKATNSFELMAFILYPCGARFFTIFYDVLIIRGDYT